MSKGTKLLLGFELLLCVVAACSLELIVQGGFNVSDAIHHNLALNLAACSVAQVVLGVGAARPSWRWGSRAAFAALLVASCAAAVAVSPQVNPVEDVPENLFVFCALVGIVNAVVFACSRKHLGCVALFALGLFACSYIQLMYTANMLVSTFVFAVAALALLALRFGAQPAAAAGGKLPAKLVASVVGLPLALCLVASVIVIGIVMPLNPPHATIKLQTIYLAYEEQPVKGVVSLSPDTDNVVTSSNVDESLDPKTTTDKKIDESSEQHDESGTSAPQKKENYLSGKYSDIDLADLVEGARKVALNSSIPWPLLILIVFVLVVVLLVLPRFVVRKVRWQRMRNKGNGTYVITLYRFFLSRFAKLGFAKPDAMTPVDYANKFRERIYPFAGAQEAGSFDHLTALFVAQQYGDVPVADEDLKAMDYLYESFYRKARKELGLFGYRIRHLTL